MFKNSEKTKHQFALAQDAFEVQDPEKSKKLHEEKKKKREEKKKKKDRHEHEEAHAQFGDYVKSIVFGGLDGIITTFAVVAAGVGSGLLYGELLIVGFANLIGDGFSMALGDFFSSRAEHEQASRLRQQYKKLCDEDLESQKQQLLKVFMDKGFDEDECLDIVKYLAENKEVFVDVMLLEVEGVSAEESRYVYTEPIRDGIITFLSFLFFGALPLFSFIFAQDKSQKSHPTGNPYFFIAIALTALSLFALGAVKNIVSKKSWWKGGLSIFLVGGLATGTAYLSGWLLERIIAPHANASTAAAATATARTVGVWQH